MLRTLAPELHPGTCAFASVPVDARLEPGDVVASIREAEGMSVVVTQAVAERAGLTPVFLCRWITLTVQSDLEAVGLTAAFARALANAGISCNVVAGINHDHIFVPVHRADDAMTALRAMQRGG